MNAKGGDEMTYDERLARLVEEERGFRAERQGFMDAKTFPDWTKPVVFTRDKKEQQRYNLGWEDARTILKCEKAQEV
mgnify:FL=1